LARYNPNGDLDIGFGNLGLVTIDFNASYFSKGIAIQPDGKIVLAGSSMSSEGSRYCLAAARYHGGSGTFIYNPNHQFDWLAPGEQAFDTLTYIVSDGILTDTATVTITIKALEQLYLPVALK
jgi:hypothetical protein